MKNLAVPTDHANPRWASIQAAFLSLPHGSILSQPIVRLEGVEHGADVCSQSPPGEIR